MSDPSVIDAEATEVLDGGDPERSTHRIDTPVPEEVADQPPAPEPEDHPVHQGPGASHALAVRPHHEGARLITGTDMAVIPPQTEMEAVAQLAVSLCAADACPVALRGKANDMFMVLLTGRDLGIAMTTAMREFHVIEGKVTLSPKVKLAMVRQQGHGKVYPHQPPRQVWAEGHVTTRLCPCGSDGPANGDTEATWHAERHDEPGILHTSTFTMAMAQRVKAKEGGVKITLDQKSTWKQYPQRMLSWRALGYLLDDVYPEVGTGLYSPDEMGAVTDEDGRVVIDVVGSSDPLPGMTAPRGHKAPPAPPEPEATLEQMGELSERIGKLVPEAQQVLRTLWTTAPEGAQPMPPLNRLLAKHVPKATAMVASVEARQTKGEFGPVPTDPDAAPAGDAEPSCTDCGDTGQVLPTGSDGGDPLPCPSCASPATDAPAAAAVEPAQDDPAPTPPEAPTEAETAVQPVPTWDPTTGELPGLGVKVGADQVEALVAALAATPVAVLKDHLRLHDKPVAGNGDTLRKRLGVAILSATVGQA